MKPNQKLPPPIQTEFSPDLEASSLSPSSSGYMSPLSPTSRKLKPAVTTGSQKTTPPANTYTSNKILSSLSSSVKNISSQPKTNEIIRTVTPNAKYYQDKEIEGKLRLLISSQFKFDELIEFGFPIHLAPSDMLSVGEEISYPEQGENADLDSPAALSNWQQQNSELEQIRESLDMSGKFSNFEDESKYNSSLASPMSAVRREMTLKFTLTPASMRADEAILYGWQKNLGGSEDALEDYEEDDVNVVNDAEQPQAAAGVTITSNQPSGSSAIPVGGFGKDQASSKTIMKRVFGKLKKGPKATGPSVMITSADMN